MHLAQLGFDLAFDTAKNAPPRPRYSNPWANPNKMCCFPEGVAVATPSGLRPIESFRRGDTVRGYNAVTGEVVGAEVIELQRHSGDFPLHAVHVDGGDCLPVTDRHYFARHDLVWLPSEQLESGDLTFAVDQAREVLGREHAGFTDHVFNLRVADVNNFFVGDSGLLVRDH